MVKRKSDKKIECFSASFNDILICQKNEAKPFIEVFVEDPENVTQQNLGILAGILEITDDSEESSYIVNYLISVIKKEYYSKPKRGVIESFESALRKANLALAKLAEHETIAWIGKTNAILLVIDKNNLHLSQSGSARALLLRGKTLTDISDGGVAGDAPNPLKTFTDIVSGRLEENDRMIITTESLFDLFSMEEIKRSALKFSPTEFIQLLKTALVNESERAATLVIEIKKEEKIETRPAVTKNKDGLNAFSQSAFSKKPTVKKPVAAPLGIAAENFSGSTNTGGENIIVKKSDERQLLVNEIKEELAKGNGEFVDKKTGHIYIKENQIPAEENSNLLETLSIWQDKISAYGSAAAEAMSKVRSKGRELKITTAPRPPRPAETTSFAPQNENPQTPVETPTAEKISPAAKVERPALLEKATPMKKAKELWHEFILSLAKNYPHWKAEFRKILERLIRAFQACNRTIFRKTHQAYVAIKRWQQKRNEKEDIKPAPEKAAAIAVTTQTSIAPKELPYEEKDWMKKYSEKLYSTSVKSNTPIPPKKEKQRLKITPNFSRLKNIFSKMDYSQKVYAALAIVFLFVVPYFIAKIGAKPVSKEIAQEQAPLALPLKADTNVTRVNEIDSIYSGQNISNVLSMNDSFFAIGENGVTEMSGGSTYSFPAGFKPKASASMDDLNLIFILGQDDRIIFWSPIDKNFQNNSIAFPGGTKILSIGTYLTYLYVLDGEANQIYRYPRATGGFGDKTDWLKNSADAVGDNIMAISDNIYLAGENGLAKFFQGKKQDFALENTATPIKIDALYTKRDAQFVYILDKTNSRIIKITLDGKIIAQYYTPAIKEATGLATDERNSLIYISLPSGVSILKMN